VFIAPVAKLRFKLFTWPQRTPTKSS